MGNNWYPVKSMRRLNKAVRVRWGWLEPFEAALIKTKPRRWATLSRNKKTGATEITYLPPERVKGGFLPARTTGEMVPLTARQADAWGPEPDAWQPIGKWPDPLPAPLPTASISSEPRMVSIGKVAFDAAGAAAEMEADREEARQDRERHRRRDGMGWWWSPAEIIYQPLGHVDRRMAEGRVMRCLRRSGPI